MLSKISNLLKSNKKIKSEKIVNWILKDNLKVRFQIQLHKYIWPAKKKGV